MIDSPIYPVILCGGSGTRLWPLSRQSYPKQYLSIISKSKSSLLQDTQKRISEIKNINNPILICNESHRFIVAEQMREININPESIILEPFGRNTAPAITLAALHALQKGNDPLLLVLSSDHNIKDSEKFLEVINKGIDYAISEKLVTFGIEPTSIETGFGYIEVENPSKQSNSIEGKKIKKFIEKPNLENARKFFKDNRYLWNSGIFLFRAKTILDEIEKFSPEIINSCKKAISNSFIDLDFQRIDKDAFSKCPNLPIDIAVMERTNKGIVLPLNAGWSDIGSWKAAWENCEKDLNGNYLKGKVISQKSSNCYFRSEKRLIVGIGLSELVVVETADAILICDINESQSVKDIVEELKTKKIKEGIEHLKIYRPWGYYISMEEGERWKVKIIKVNPKARLSLQMHHHRAEHWIVVSGTAKVEINNKETILSENESTYIPLGSRHRLSNPGKIPLELIEVQSGAYLGEDDIERIKDEYGRL